MLKESGGIKRIINKIPEAARVTFENNKYNPDKKVRADPVYAEAEYEEEGVDERQRSSTPKRPGPTLQLPEAKMAARPDSMTSYRNSKQDVIPSEAQKPKFRVSLKVLVITSKKNKSEWLWNDPQRKCSMIQQKHQTLVPVWWISSFG